MAVKKYRPTTPSRRFRTVSSDANLGQNKPERRLVKPLPRTGGRNVAGRVTAYHRGGRAKRRYRVIDFKRDKVGIPARVASLEYDPNRSARIALLVYRDGEKRYVIAPDGLSVGEEVICGPGVEPKVGNTLPLSQIPPGTEIHNLEMVAGQGARLVRSAGTRAQLLAKEGKYGHVRLPSGEVRLLSLDCKATVGGVGNVEHSALVGGKAGWSRWKGRRPNVRGVAMNPVDHPLGGGEGKSSGGRHPVSPWGKPTKGYRTRRRKASDRLIVQRRPKKKRKGRR